MSLLLAADIRKQRLIEKYKDLKVSVGLSLWKIMCVCVFSPYNQPSFFSCHMIILLTFFFLSIIRIPASLKHLLRKGGRRMLQRTTDTCHIVDPVTTMLNEAFSFKALLHVKCTLAATLWLVNRLSMVFLTPWDVLGECLVLVVYPFGFQLAVLDGISWEEGEWLVILCTSLTVGVTLPSL